MLAFVLISLEQLLPALLGLAAIAWLLGRLSKAQAGRLAARRAWLAQRAALEAELAAAIAGLEPPERLAAIGARLDAQERLEPRLPAWLFWAR